MSEVAADDLDVRPAHSGAGVAFDTNGRPAGAVAGERTISPVAGRLGWGKSGKALALSALVAGCGVFLAATWNPAHGHKAKSGPKEPARQVVDWTSVKMASSAMPSAPSSTREAVLQGPGSPETSPRHVSSEAAPGAPTLADPGVGAPTLTTGGANGQIVPEVAAGAGGAAGSEGGASPSQARAEATAAAAGQAAQARAAKLQAIRSAPLLAYSREVRDQGASLAGDGRSAAPRAEGAAPSELDQLRRGSTLGLIRAQRLPDRNFLLTAGALLPCVLETAIDTSAPGFVTCRITRDIYGDSGGVVLIEKGSRVLGEYRSGFSQGHARIFVLWDRITTTGGVAVEVNSPASDALGRAGFDGRIDSHFWQRFGGALLLTTVGGGVSAAATADARFANVTQAPNEAAAAALQNSVNIPPTLTKPQGAEVAIFVSHDLDFASVYALKGR